MSSPNTSRQQTNESPLCWVRGYLPPLRFAVMPNLEVRSQNRAMEILDPTIREQVKQIIHKLLGGV